jgi:ubiquinone/menaquinone biosynthesis C-methylase UbiE
MARLSLALDTADLAEHYEQASADRQFRFGQALVADLGIEAGDRVLDIGSGTGLLARHVAELVGPTGRVEGLDPLPLRVAIAKQKGVPNAGFRVGTADNLSEFAPESFDAVYLNAVFHWLPEKLEPLRQIARVLKPGGRLGISTGSREHRNALQAIKADVLSREPFNRFQSADDGLGLPYAVTAAELGDLLKLTGFAVARIDLLPNGHFLPSGNDAIRFSEASSFGNFLGHLPETIRPQARAAIEAELETLRTPEGIPLGGTRIVAIATRL